jgi:hypothetical protein
MIGAAGFVASFLAMAPQAQAEPNGPHALQIRLSPTGATPAATGKAKFRFVRRYSRFTVETHGLLPGSYDILIGGGAVGTMDVGPDEAPDAVCRFTLDSHLASGMLFDPRGTSVEVVNRQTRVTELSAYEFPADKSEERRRVEIETDLPSTGVQPAASGKAVFRSFRGRSRLELEIEGAAPGTYDVVVGDALRAQLVVTSLDAATLSFDSLPTADADAAAGESIRRGRDHGQGHGHGSPSLLLTFDPRGLPVAVSIAGQNVLLIDPFPEE